MKTLREIFPSKCGSWCLGCSPCPSTGFMEFASIKARLRLWRAAAFLTRCMPCKTLSYSLCKSGDSGDRIFFTAVLPCRTFLRLLANEKVAKNVRGHKGGTARLVNLTAPQSFSLNSTTVSVTVQQAWHSTNLALPQAPLEAELELETRGKC